MEFEDFLKWHNINLKIIDLPCTVRGFAIYNGFQYLVLINSKYNYIQQKETMIHELIHILDNHFTYPQGYESRCEKEVDHIIKELKLDYII